MKDASQILSEVLNERKAANAAYSLRAFARDLGVTPGQLSHVINGYRGFGPKTAEKIAHKLCLEEQELYLFKESLKAKFAPSKAQRILSRTKLTEASRLPSEKSLQLDLFNTIAQWHHFTLVELVKISGKQKKPITWFSKKLGLSENEVKISLERLIRLELISKTITGYQVNQDTVIADQGVPTEAIKKFHEQILQKAISALTFQSKNERYGMSAAMPVRIKDLEKAKKLIKKFKTDFAKEISSHKYGEEIYCISMQFFRLTQLDEV